MIAISRKSGLSLTPCGEGDDLRFARIFRKTWRLIPAEARRIMRDHWPESFPSIMLVDDWPDRRGAFAKVSRYGFLLQFHSRTIDAMPTHVAMGLVGHELAHVTQFARLQCFALPDGIELEIEADEMAIAWGFLGRTKIEAWFNSARPTTR